MFYILAFFYKKTSASFITLGFLPFIKDHTTYGNTTAEVGTVISSGTVYMDAGNNVNARQVSIYADEGPIAIKAGSNVAAGNNPPSSPLATAPRMQTASPTTATSTSPAPISPAKTSTSPPPAT